VLYSVYIYVYMQSQGHLLKGLAIYIWDIVQYVYGVDVLYSVYIYVYMQSQGHLSTGLALRV